MKRLNITITAEAGVEAVAFHQGETSSSQAPPHPLYSPELFMNALVDFIVTTDQVLFLFLFFFSNY